MEIEAVSRFKKWMDLLAKQKTALQNACNREGQRPKDRKCHGQLLDEFMAQHADMAMMKEQGNMNSFGQRDD